MAPPVLLIVKMEFPAPSQVLVTVILGAAAAPWLLNEFVGVLVAVAVTVGVLIMVAVFVAVFVAVNVSVEMISGLSSASVALGVGVSVDRGGGVCVATSDPVESSDGISVGAAIVSVGGALVGSSFSRGASVAAGGGYAPSAPPAPARVSPGMQEFKTSERITITIRKFENSLGSLRVRLLRMFSMLESPAGS